MAGGEVGLPSRQGGVDRLDARTVQVVGHIGGDCAVDFVGGACADFVEGVENVRLHHDELCHAVEHDGVAQGDEVDPAAAALASGYGAVLVAAVAHFLAGGVEEFGGEGAGANTCAICLEDAEDLADAFGSETESGAGARADGVRRCHEGIRAEVDVEHCALGAFAKYALAIGKTLVNVNFGVDEVELGNVLEGVEELDLGLVECGKVDLGAESGEHVEVALTGGLVFCREVVLGVAKTKAVARNLVGVAGTDALACGADFRLALGAFAGGVEQTVGWQDDVGFAGNFEDGLEVDARGLEFAGLLGEEYGVEHDARTDDVDLAVLEDAGGNRAEDEFLSVELKGVSGVGTALETCDYVVAGSQDIDNFAFAFVTPLET